MLHYRWLKPVSPINTQYPQLHLPSYMMNILNRRGLKTPRQIKQFLHPRLADLKDPYQMHDMRQGVKHIKKAIKKHEKITIYGDYDVDGMTSTSIMYSLLKGYLHANVHYFLPNRFKDGYGPNKNEYKRIIANGTKLLITVDNGISGLNEIAYARKHGMDVIITDHHDFPADIPNANEIIMAQYPGHKYNHGLEDFCGAGIALKIATAVMGYVPKKLLDLACLGTVADSVSLTHEDRIIVAQGLKVIHHDKRPGIRALAKVAGVQLSQLKSTDLSFSLIPRLNALGRMQDPNPAVELLTTRSMDRAMQIARMIEKCNTRRKSIMHKQTQEALKQASTPENLRKCTLVLANKKWFPGIVGIIASQVLGHYYKPIIVIGHLKADDKLGIDRGSGRSIAEFNMFAAMHPMQKYETKKYKKAHPHSKKKNVMTSFGGHPFACGLSILPSQIPRLRDDLEKAGQQANLPSVMPTVKPDFEWTPKDITFSRLHELDKLQPFGVDNPAPLIDMKLPRIYNVQQMGQLNNHLKFTMAEPKNSLHAVAWKMGEWYHDLKSNPYNVEIAGSMGPNTYNNHTYMQFTVKYIHHYAPKAEVNRSIIGNLYKCLYQHPNVHFNDYLYNIIKPLHELFPYSINQIFSSLAILNELHLITVKHGVVYVISHPQKTSLNASRIYNTLTNKH